MFDIRWKPAMQTTALYGSTMEAIIPLASPRALVLGLKQEENGGWTSSVALTEGPKEGLGNTTYFKTAWRRRLCDAADDAEWYAYALIRMMNAAVALAREGDK